jgi:hypothetical protein
LLQDDEIALGHLGRESLVIGHAGDCTFVGQWYGRGKPLASEQHIRHLLREPASVSYSFFCWRAGWESNPQPAD